ncbi:MAG TPA: phosphoribosyltransferase family protein [Candidatus Saccharimonadales bacterium]|nr:phosphoribosyltransferase family protein [Candidatus Saccharimonadales bacterium]
MLREFYHEDDGKYWPDHEEIKQMSIKVGELIAESELSVVNLVAVTRGGLIPTGYISRLLHWSQTETMDMNSYRRNEDGTESPSIIRITKRPILNNPDGTGTLFIDDVSDKGGTVRRLKTDYPNSKVAVIYSKLSADDPNFLADYVGEYTERPDAWINFPWEVKTKQSS